MSSLAGANRKQRRIRTHHEIELWIQHNRKINVSYILMMIEHLNYQGVDKFVNSYKNIKYHLLQIQFRKV